MEDNRTTPFAGTPLVAGCILVATDDVGDANLWEIVRVYDDGRCDARCPFNRARTENFEVRLGLNEWVGPDLPSVLSYLRLMGITAQ